MNNTGIKRKVSPSQKEHTVSLQPYEGHKCPEALFCERAMNCRKGTACDNRPSNK